MTLQLVQDGVGLSGTLNLFNNTGGRIVESGAVTGAVNDAGSLALTGTTNTTDPSEPSHTVLQDWASSLSTDGSGMSGQFTQDEFFKNFWGTQEVKENCGLTLHRTGS